MKTVIRWYRVISIGMTLALEITLAYAMNSLVNTAFLFNFEKYLTLFALNQTIVKNKPVFFKY